jgi:signal peptide peptidase SppA
MHPDDTAPCFCAHLGIWCCEPHALQSLAQAVRSGVAPQLASDRPMAIDPIHAATADVVETRGGGRYTRSGDGIAVLRLAGMLQKSMNKFSEGTSTIAFRGALRAAVADPAVESVLIAVDSPGGTTAGTAQLADDIAAAARVLPVAALVDDLAASAAYWAIAAAGHIVALPSAEVGSIGAIAVVEDASQALERAGIQVHVLTTSPLKSAGDPRVAQLPAHLEHMSDRVAHHAGFFFRAVQAARGLSDELMARITDGRVVGADAALAIGLVDAVGDYESASAWLRSQADAQRTQRRQRAGRALRRIG